MSNESSIRKNGRSIGKVVEFENCTIYSNRNSGVHEIHGSIHEAYLNFGGPTGELGFPTSDEQYIPAPPYGNTKYNTFAKGALIGYANIPSIHIARPFKIFIGRINTDEDEGFLQGQNDLYIRVIVKDGNREIFSAVRLRFFKTDLTI